MSHYPFVAPFIFTSFPKSLGCVFVCATSLFACVYFKGTKIAQGGWALFGSGAAHLHKSKQHEYLMPGPANFFSGCKMQMPLLLQLFFT